jgi:hypothetical protein
MTKLLIVVSLDPAGNTVAPLRRRVGCSGEGRSEKRVAVLDSERSQDRNGCHGSKMGQYCFAHVWQEQAAAEARASAWMKCAVKTEKLSTVENLMDTQDI